MRINQSTRQIIVETARQVYGIQTKVWLFGSRTNDKLRGGDLDLYLEAEQDGDVLENKLAFLAALKNRIGEQRIDLIIKQDGKSPIEQEAKDTGILL